VARRCFDERIQGGRRQDGTAEPGVEDDAGRVDGAPISGQTPLAQLRAELAEDPVFRHSLAQSLSIELSLQHLCPGLSQQGSQSLDDVRARAGSRELFNRREAQQFFYLGKLPEQRLGVRAFFLACLHWRLPKGNWSAWTAFLALNLLDLA